MNESPGTLELLSSRMDALERRVHALEHPDKIVAPPAKSVTEQASAADDNEAASLQTENIFLLLGRAMLGIAGAYVLRAIAQADVMPKYAVAALAITYAFAWLIWAARVSKADPIAPFVYAATSSVILVPMLWEETLHFHDFAPLATAGVLAAFVVTATAIGLRDTGSRFVWIAQSVGPIAAFSLAIAAHNLLPFIYMLLVALLVVEYARSLDHVQTAWPLIALVTDGAIWGLIFIYSGPQSARAEFPALSLAALVFPSCLLFAINGSGIAVRVILHQRRISAFESIQGMIAFLLLASCVLVFAPKNGSAALGILCALLSAAAYAASFLRLRHLAEPRNFRVFIFWSGALLVAGALWSLPPAGAEMALAIAGSAAYIIAAQINFRTLEFHGSLFLCVAAVFSGMARFVFETLAGSSPGKPTLAVWIMAISAAAAYAVAKDSRDDHWVGQGLRLVPALLAASAISGLLVNGALALAALVVSLDAHHVAFLRTLVICAVSLGLAFAGSRWGRFTMMRLAYLALAFVLAKLLFEDLRHGRMEFIAGSIFIFAITLIAVPRLVRMGGKPRETLHMETPVHSNG